MERNERMIAALRRERATYVARGDEDRVQQVDDQLRHYGAEPEVSAASGGPEGRAGLAAQQSTASGAEADAAPPAAKSAPRATRASKS